MIKVKTSNREFQVQKKLLSKHSGYFRALFYHTTMRENQINMVDLSKSVVSDVGFECLLRYMEFDVFDIKVNQLDDVIPTIDYLQLDHLQDLMYLQVWQDIDGSNFADVWKISRKYHLEEYEVLVKTFISENLCRKFVEEHIVQFCLLNVEQIRYIFEEMSLKLVLSDLEAFQIVCLWLDNCSDQIQRNGAYQILTTCIRFHAIPLRHLVELVRPKLNTYGDQRLMKHLEAKIRYHLHPVTQATSHERHHDLKFADDVFIMPYGRVGRGTIGRGLEVYDLNSGVWNTTSCRVNTNLFPRAATTSLDNFLYVAGGLSEISSSTVAHWSLGDMQMQYISTEQCQNSEDNKGGIVPAVSSSVYRYNPCSNSWIEVASMQSGRLDFCLVQTKDAIYAMGGINPIYRSDKTISSSNNKRLDSVECYKPYSNTWRSCASLVKPIQNGRGVEVDGKIYVMDPTGCLQRYCVDENKWELLTRLHRCRKIHAVFAWKGRPHILLSETGCQLKCCHLYKYDIDDNDDDDDDDDDTGLRKLSSGAGKKKEALRMVGTCLLLDSVSDVVAGFVYDDQVVVITSLGTMCVCNGKRWTITKRNGRQDCQGVNNDAGRNSSLQPCVMRLPRYLIQSRDMATS